MTQRKLSPWLPGDVSPKRIGFYRVQDSTMNCSCCWFDAHWDGMDWHTDMHSGKGNYRTLLFQSNVKRWRGLVQKTPNVKVSGCGDD